MARRGTSRRQYQLAPIVLFLLIASPLAFGCDDFSGLRLRDDAAAGSNSGGVSGTAVGAHSGASTGGAGADAAGQGGGPSAGAGGESGASPECPKVQVADLRASASMVLWLDAGSGVSLVNGRVEQWADRSGKHNHAMQEDPLARPTFASQGLRCRPAVGFADGLSLTIPDNPSLAFGSSGFAAYAVVAYRNIDTGPIFSKFDEQTTLRGVRLLANVRDPIRSVTPITGFGVQIQVSDVGTISTGNGFNDGVPRMVSTMQAGEGMSLRVNAQMGARAIVPVLDLTTSVPALIGRHGVRHLHGELAELIVTAGTPQVSEISEIETYLMRKYDL